MKPGLSTPLVLVALAGTLAAVNSSRAEPAPDDPLGKQVAAAREKGVEFLKRHQKTKGVDAGNWEGDGPITLFQPGGEAGLALLALVEAGVKPDDEVVARGLKYLRTVEPKHTYVVSLQIQVFCRASRADDADRIKRNVEWLERAVVYPGGKFGGWTYESPKSNNRPDNSNTHYAVAALHAAHKADVPVSDRNYWVAIRDYYLRTQFKDGGWAYQPSDLRATHTMTVSGLLGLTLARDVLGKDGEAADPAVKKAYEWLAKEFKLEARPQTFYNLDAIAALGRAAKVKELGTKGKAHDWYRLGAEWLVKNQQANGSWTLDETLSRFPLISTSFALRFLASRPD
jgi:hypothetical protein